jgi:hypothetical protein
VAPIGCRRVMRTLYPATGRRVTLSLAHWLQALEEKKAEPHPASRAIFARSRPAWAVIPAGLAIYDAMPPE